MTNAKREIAPPLTLAAAMRRANQHRREVPGVQYFAMRHCESGDYAVGSLALVMVLTGYEVFEVKGLKGQGYTPKQIRDAEREMEVASAQT